MLEPSKVSHWFCAARNLIKIDKCCYFVYYYKFYMFCVDFYYLSLCVCFFVAYFSLDGSEERKELFLVIGTGTETNFDNELNTTR